jgi:hypothetical protein
MRTRSKKLTLATSLAVVVTAIVAAVASAGTTVSSDPGQPTPSTPSDSAAFPGGGTVSVPGVAYPRGTAAPAVGTPQSGPSPAETQKTTDASPSSGTVEPGRPKRLPSVRQWCPQRYGNLLSCIPQMRAHARR